MFKNLFGSSKPAKPDAAQQKKIDEEKANLEKERAKEKLDENLKKTEEKLDQLNVEIGKLENEVKQHIMSKRKDKAAVVLKKLKGKKDVALKLQKQSAFLAKQSGLLEDSEQDTELFETMKEVNKINQKNRDQQDLLRDELATAKELDQEAKMRRDELNDLMDDDEDQDDLDDMMKEYEDQANEELKMGFDKADKNIITPGKQTSQLPAQQNKKADNFDNLMAELMN